MKLPRKVLVANRGEIAVRVIRTLRALGLRSVAVYSDADRDALHVRLADEAERIGPAPAAESYLRGEAIVAAARARDADAVHPGYGFLSENAAFAQQVEKAGLIFVGPTPKNIARLGDKLSARSVLREAGLPPVPGSGSAVTREALRRTAQELGFPLLLKAVAGGGGKGIRIVRTAAELSSAFDAATSEAKSSFGSSDVIAERYVEKARHVEVQVLGDGAGGVRLFFERDCSTQRRLQKLLEETPSPGMTHELREKLLLAAGRAVASERYRGAGTLEFLLSQDGELYFLEMNTRIQVEHPVTEETTGADLVAEQIAIAAGAKLPRWKDDLAGTVLPPSGAAVEFRVNAEDPSRDFAPSTGRISSVRLPAGPGIRVDSALEVGAMVPPYYDSLLAKVVARGVDRGQAFARLRAALYELRLSGVATTVPLGLALLEDEGLLRAQNHCQYLAERLGDARFLRGSLESEEAPFVAAAAAWLRQANAGSSQRARASTALPATSGAPASSAALSPWALLQRFSLKEST
jgi:acetyl-CoA carboxylase biotin carboxylase subunit